MSSNSEPNRTVVFPFVGDRVGGSHRSAVLLIQSLRRTAWQPVVFVHRTGQFTALLDEAEIPYEFVPTSAALREGRGALARSLLVDVPRFVLRLRASRAAVVHTNDIRMHRTWGAAARLAGARHVWHQRTIFDAPRRGKLLLSLPDRIIAISRTVLDTLPQSVRGKTCVIPNPFDISPSVDRGLARAALLAQVGIEDRPLVGLVGSLTPQKRGNVLLDAVELMRDRAGGREAVFVLIGGDRGEWSAHLRARAESMQDVHVLGYRTDVERCMAGLDVLAAPAVDEGQGRAVIEAMLAGTPVVAAASAGHLEVVRDGETGVLVPPDDPVALADALQDLLGAPTTRTRLSAAARVWAAGRFSAEAHVEAVTGCYSELFTFGRGREATARR